MLITSKSKVIVAMSGGVDSSVSAWLLKQQGYQVEGLFMKNWEEDDNEKYCASAKDLEDTQKVCNKIGIVLHVINFSAEYWDNVFEVFLAEYQIGRTPNPDVLCNKEIKFKTFMKFAIQNLKADFIATGHHVRRTDINKYSLLLRGLDKNKDQSYFLYTLSHEQISRCLFPIGELTKQKVRCIANELNLVTANKKNSTGICFIGKRNFRNFISHYLPAQPGSIISVYDDKIIGVHQGLMYYTIGQRKGLGIGGGINKNNKQPWYVVNKDLINNNLIVAQGHNNNKLMSIELTANQLHWVDRKPLKTTLNCTLKTCYRQPDINCLIKPLSEDSISVTFNKPIRAVTPGQSVVFYLSAYCIGGGIIENNKTL